MSLSKSHMIIRIGTQSGMLNRLRAVSLMIAVAGAALGAPQAVAQQQQPAPPAVRIEGEVTTAPKDDDFADAAALAQAIGPVIALFALIFLGLQIRGERKDARDQRAEGYQERMGNREFLQISTRTFAFLSARDAADCVQKLEAFVNAGWADNHCLPRTPRLDQALPAINDIQQTLGFFESLGTVFNRNDLNRKVIVESFATFPVQIFAAGWWYVCWRRSGRLLGETDVWAEFDLLVREILRRKPALRKDAKPNKRIRALCLPEDLAGAPPTDWRRCEALSTTLSDRVIRAIGDDVAAFATVLNTLLRTVDDVAAHGPVSEPLKVTLLAIPSDIEIQAGRWAPIHVRAEHAARRLSALGAARFDEVIRRLGGRPPTDPPPPTVEEDGGALLALIEVRVPAADDRERFEAALARAAGAEARIVLRSAGDGA
jgi:hypothetical protein